MIGPSPSSSVRSGQACVARRAGQNWIIPSARAPPARASLGTAETEQVLRRFTRGGPKHPTCERSKSWSGRYVLRSSATTSPMSRCTRRSLRATVPGARTSHGETVAALGVTPGDLSGGSDEFGGQSAGAAGFPFLLGSRRGDPFPSIRCAAGQQSGEYEQKFPGRSNHLLPDQTFINSSRPDLPFFPAVAAE